MRCVTQENALAPFQRERGENGKGLRAKKKPSFGSHPLYSIGSTGSLQYCRSQRPPVVFERFWTCPYVSRTVARDRGGVGPTPGITVIATPRAAAAPVMPGVCPGCFHICT